MGTEDVSDDIIRGNVSHAQSVCGLGYICFSDQLDIFTIGTLGMLCCAGGCLCQLCGAIQI